DVFLLFGVLVEIEEKHFAAVTALSGSGPAFIFVIIEALVDAGMKLGLSYDTSMELVIETIKGSAELLQKEGKHPGEFRHLVTSPGGTTIEGIYSLEREGLRGILMKMIFDTYKKALELQGDSHES
ncbi:MAG: pyrroline-5-carboxylate reductase, partial [Thermotogae bacterium]|nr:pyrroline-5-carboxylate reductase [Thermotogota bacterium]